MGPGPGRAVVGVVLAGGEARRMGTDKALVTLSGRSLVERAAGLLGTICREVVVADGGRELVAGLRSVADGAGTGPAAGLLGAAVALPGWAMLAVACDMPGVSAGLLRRLLSADDGADWVVPRWTRLEPLCALYRPVALATLARQVARGRLAPRLLAEAPDLVVRYLEIGPGEGATLFANLNTPDDLERWRAGAG